MKHYATGSSNPEAYITKGKQRVKQFNGLVYLNDGDNFEVEIFNPTTNHILAQISMNGKSISRSGLILRPGERVFLERYIDTNNKFVYSTYEVNGGNKEVQKAIAFNGIVKVEFFNEQQPIYNYGSTVTYINPPTLTIWPPLSTPTVYYSSGVNSLSSGGVNTLTSTPLNGTVTGAGASYSCNCNSNPVLGNKTSVTMDTLGFMDMSQASMELPKSFPPDQPRASRKIETGTVEKGESSKQSFETSSRNFQYSSFHNVEWKIIPKSQQPITSKDLQQYCTECGSKIVKSTFKFCPNCGEKIG